ncbi:hypothetical protein SAMN05421747_10413 [Parapedobacter composti]|uniref:Uncharacterized protein n=1 Tax=Parapedobacter composti TaxID=623281 RepID=A0A1I1G6G6_9SPHI|nr:hypothetical protein [Parapedobacter composti]SFC07389.1 hypothetical protein SAMN05421747_10413 [Parapedobacter composti]
MEHLERTIDIESKATKTNFIERNNEEIVTAFEALNMGGKIRFLSDLLESEAKILNIDRDGSGNVRFVVNNDNYIKLK